MVTHQEIIENMVESASFYFDQFELEQPQVIEQSQPESMQSGSFLKLTANNGQDMIVGILGTKESQQQLSRHVLGLSGDEKNLSEQEVEDVMRESINVISGLLKSRLNHHFEDSLELGIPYYQTVESLPDNTDIRQLTTNDLSLCIYTHYLSKS